MNMDRRSFLIGTGAALALATIPKLVTTVVEPVILPDSANVVSRTMYEVAAEAGKPWPGQSHHMLTIGTVDQPGLNLHMGVRGFVRWVACPEGELILKRDQDMLALIDWWPPPQAGQIHFLLHDTFDDGGYMIVAQRFSFIGLQPIAHGPMPIFTERRYPLGHPKHVPLPELPDDWDDDLDLDLDEDY